MIVVGIVGSRYWGDDENRVRREVEDFVACLALDTIVVSGGAPGVDTWAAVAARARGLAVEELKPDGTLASIFARNSAIARRCDWLRAWQRNRSRGTQDTIWKARAFGKPVKDMNEWREAREAQLLEEAGDRMARMLQRDNNLRGIAAGWSRLAHGFARSARRTGANSSSADERDGIRLEIRRFEGESLAVQLAAAIERPLVIERVQEDST